MLAALGQHLDCNIVGNKVLLDQRTAECILGLACGGETYFDFLEADLNEVFPEFQLFLQGHGDYQSLISVAEVNGAPHGGFCDTVLLYPVIAWLGRHKITFLIVIKIFHSKLSFLFNFIYVK